MHHGMLVTGIPYSEAHLSSTTSGGTPYGPSHLAGAEGNNPITEAETGLCQAFAKDWHNWR